MAVGRAVVTAFLVLLLAGEGAMMNLGGDGTAGDSIVQAAYAQSSGLSVNITSPADNSTVDSSFSTVSGTASDDVGVTAVGIAVDAFAGSNNKGFIAKWGSSGSGNGNFSSPYGVAVDPGDGSIYVVDSANNRVQKFDSNGTFLTKWGSSGTGNGNFSSPYGVAVDSDGNVYVTDGLNSRIQKFTNAGAFLTKWGSSGTGNGNFSSPVGVAVSPDGSVYVVDSNNDRIQKFGPTYTAAALATPGGTSTTWSLDIPPSLLSAGSNHTITARATDDANHTATFSITVFAPAIIQTPSQDSSGGSRSGGGGGGGGSVILYPQQQSVTLLPESYFSDRPLSRVQITNFTFLDAAGNTLTQARAGQRVSIAGTFTNYQDAGQKYAFIVQVADADGFVEYISWQQGEMASGQTVVDAATLWSPDYPGSYAVQIFVWDGIGGSPTALSEVAVKHIEVTS